MSANAAVPFWRAAGMTYITYSNLCAGLVRQCLKEPHRSESLAREKVHFNVSKWVDGKPEKPSLMMLKCLIWSFACLFNSLVAACSISVTSEKCTLLRLVIFSLLCFFSPALRHS